MMIYNEWEHIPYFKDLFSITIGFFDGMHIGHRKIIETLKQTNNKTALVTFLNHPGSFLLSKPTPPLITSNASKIEIFKELKIDLILMLPFTFELADLTFDLFLKKIRSKIPFNSLVLGKDDAFGKNRLGTETALKELSSQDGFEAIYIEKVLYRTEMVSSTLIRKLIQNGDFKNAATLLGRPFALPIRNNLTNPLLCPLEDLLALPPKGNYEGRLRQGIQTKKTSLSLQEELGNKFVTSASPFWEGFNQNQPLLLEFY